MIEERHSATANSGSDRRVEPPRGFRVEISFTGPFRYLLAINVVHGFHHLNSAKEGDVNFGLFTQLTDYLLGTAFFDPDRRIKLGELHIEHYPVDYVSQMIEPFLASDGAGARRLTT